MKVTSDGGRPGWYKITVSAQFCWFRPIQRQSGASSACLMNQPIRKLCVTISSWASAAASSPGVFPAAGLSPGGPANCSIAARARAAPSLRSVVV